jgi:hypothetical protein
MLRQLVVQRRDGGSLCTEGDGDDGGPKEDPVAGREAASRRLRAVVDPEDGIDTEVDGRLIQVDSGAEQEEGSGFFRARCDQKGCTRSAGHRPRTPCASSC